jgi:mRNA interferase MazF
MAPARRAQDARARRVVIEQGDLFWADLPEPHGSEAGYRRPVVVVESNSLIRSLLNTVVCVPLTSSVDWAEFPGNVLLDSRTTKLKRDSVAFSAQILAVDKRLLTERIGRVSRSQLAEILGGIDLVLGR